MLGHGSTGVAGTGTGVTGIGVSGNSDSNIGVSGTGGTQGVLGHGSIGVQGNGGFTGVSGTGTNNGVYGTGTGTTGIGVNGQGGQTGVYGGGSTYGVEGVSTGGALTAGVRGEGYNIGVWGYCTSTTSTGGVGVYGSKGSGAYAGYFDGPVFIQGPLAKPGGSFKIDHPLDPANKYLYHSFVESPDMKNIYDGIAILDEQGRAFVDLPDWFETLNRDFRYQLTCLEGYAPVFISAKISGGRFEIAGGQAGQEVSWQVTGIRQDEWAKAHRIPVEEVKDAKDTGKYLHPEVFNKPAELRIDNQS